MRLEEQEETWRDACGSPAEKKERKIPAFARENSSNSISFIPSNVQLVYT